MFQATLYREMLQSNLNEKVKKEGISEQKLTIKKVLETIGSAVYIPHLNNVKSLNEKAEYKMSSQRGNTQRIRPQKYQNRHVFKNDLHDKSQKTKAINSIQVTNVCERCKKIIEWKIKYKKFKPLKAPAKCLKCEQKIVKHAYHIMCGNCAKEKKVCPKCGVEAELIEAPPSHSEQMNLDAELQSMIEKLPERKKRTFIRYMNRKVGKMPIENQTELNECNKIFDEKKIKKEESKLMREDLLEKLKSLSVKEDLNETIPNSDYSDDDNYYYS